MLKLKKATERVSTLKTIGTVAEFVGEGGKIEPASITNFNGTIVNGVKVLKRVSLKLMDKDNNYEYVNCSKPVGDWLREVTGEALKERLIEVASFPILELPQTISDESDPNFGEPVMITDKETGEEKQLILYAISFTGTTDMSATSVSITKDMIKAEAVKRAINFEDLIAI